MTLHLYKIKKKIILQIFGNPFEKQYLCNVEFFLSSSTDDDYDKSSIRHFKSWDEERESSNQTIDDYDNGIKHFQD